MREVILALVGTLVVGLTTYFIEEHLFESEAKEIAKTLSTVTETYVELLNDCDDRLRDQISRADSERGCLEVR